MHPMGGLSPDDLGALVDTLVHAAWDREGGTYHLSGAAVDPMSAEHLWAVGRPHQSLRIGGEVCSPDLVAAWVESVVRMDPLHDTFGVWWDQEDERVVFDVVDLYHTEVEAVREGKLRKEQAIYDLATDMERFL